MLPERGIPIGEPALDCIKGVLAPLPLTDLGGPALRGGGGVAFEDAV